MTWPKLLTILSALSILASFVVKATTLQDKVESLESRTAKLEAKMDTIEENTSWLVRAEKKRLKYEGD